MVLTDNFPQRGFDFFKVMIVAHLILYIPVNFIIMRYRYVIISIIILYFGSSLIYI